MGTRGGNGRETGLDQWGELERMLVADDDDASERAFTAPARCWPAAILIDSVRAPTPFFSSSALLFSAVIRYPIFCVYSLVRIVRLGKRFEN